MKFTQIYRWFTYYPLVICYSLRTGKSTIFQWVNPPFLWPFSLAMSVLLAKKPRLGTSPASPFDRSHPPARRAASEASPRFGSRVPDGGDDSMTPGPESSRKDLKGWILNDSFTNICICIFIYIYIDVEWCRYVPGSSLWALKKRSLRPKRKRCHLWHTGLPSDLFSSLQGYLFVGLSFPNGAWM